MQDGPRRLSVAIIAFNRQLSMRVSPVFMMLFPLIQSMFLFIQPAPQGTRVLTWKWSKSIFLMSDLLEECLHRLFCFSLIFIPWQRMTWILEIELHVCSAWKALYLTLIIRIKHPCQHPIICYDVSYTQEHFGN